MKTDKPKADQSDPFRDAAREILTSPALLEPLTAYMRNEGPEPPWFYATPPELHTKLANLRAKVLGQS